jgi:ribosome maturation factor RimP
MVYQAPAEWREIIEPVVAGLGYELVGVEYHSAGRHGLLRVYIDMEGGVTVDDCARVSHQVSGVLDVEDFIRGRYTLEVSSPGLDRPLFTVADFDRFRGRDVRIRLDAPLDGRRKFSGRLVGTENGCVRIQMDEGEFSLPLVRIEQARLIPDI